MVVIGKPSAEMADRLEQDEKQRIQDQRDQLGDEGLARVEKILENAIKDHDKEIPTEILTSFPVPDVKSISWIPVQSLQQPGKGKGRAPRRDQTGNAALVKHVESDGPPLPFFVQYDHVQV